MEYKNKVVIYDNNEYLVVETVENDGRTFAYLVNNQDELDSKFVELSNNKMYDIVPEFFLEVIYPLFVKKMESNYC